MYSFLTHTSSDSSGHYTVRLFLDSNCLFPRQKVPHVLYFNGCPIPSSKVRTRWFGSLRTKCVLKFLFFGAAEEEEEGSVFVAVNLLHYKRLKMQNSSEQNNHRK